ncbi:MAG: nicotinamide-nucleotide amidase, partial [Gammaproteobacteria bacterium]
GRVCFGLCYQEKTTSLTVEFGALGRTQVRHAARDHAITLLLNAITSAPN